MRRNLTEHCSLPRKTGLHSFKSRRPGCAPLFYFKGTMQQLIELPVQELQKAMEEIAKANKESEPQTEKIAQFKQELVELATAAQRQKKHSIVGISMPPRGNTLHVRIEHFPNGQLRIIPQPVIHGVGRENPLENLFGILAKGFNGSTPPNVEHATERKTQSSIWAEKSTRVKGSDYPIGDKYNVIMLTTTIPNQFHPTSYFVKNAPPQQILRVNINLNPKIAKEEALERKEIYKRLFADRGLSWVPVSCRHKEKPV